MVKTGVLLAVCLYGLALAATAVPSISYQELDYTFTHKGNTTTMTGVRSVNDSTSLVYMSGFTWVNLEYTDGMKSNYGAFIFRGDITGEGDWFGNFNYPSSPGSNVSGTFFYGPCSASASGIENIPDAENFFQAVGDYSTFEGGIAQYAMLFQGYLNGTGTWKTLDPTPLLGENPTTTIWSAIGHSTMGGLAVGNFNTEDAPEHFHAFVYTIADDRFDELVYINEQGERDITFSITAYCIWHNRGTDTYSIAGGIGKAGLIDGFIVTWNATARAASDWRFFHHPNSTITHFQGLWPDFANNGVGYSFAANWINVLQDTRGTSFVYVSNISSPDRSPSNVNWYDYHFPNTVNNSANSVYYNTTVAFFELPSQIYAHGFVAQFTFGATGGATDGDDGGGDGLSQSEVIAVAATATAVGVAVLAFAAYIAVAGKSGMVGTETSTAAAAGGGASAEGSGGDVTMNPVSSSGGSGGNNGERSFSTV